MDEPFNMEIATVYHLCAVNITIFAHYLNSISQYYENKNKLSTPIFVSCLRGQSTIPALLLRFKSSPTYKLDETRCRQL